LDHFLVPRLRLGNPFLRQAPLGTDYEIAIIALWHAVSPSGAWGEIAVPKLELGNEEIKRRGR